ERDPGLSPHLDVAPPTPVVLDLERLRARQTSPDDYVDATGKEIRRQRLVVVDEADFDLVELRSAQRELVEGGDGQVAAQLPFLDPEWARADPLPPPARIVG